MNKQIIQLAEEAGFILWKDEEWKPLDEVFDWSSSYDNELEKFYELIVQRCLEIIESEQERYCNLTNGSGTDYNDFIDCLENLKLELEDEFLRDE